MHCFFHFDPTKAVEGHYKTSTRKTASGTAELRTVAMGKADIDDLCVAISDCIELVDDLVMKIWFRRRFIAAASAGEAASGRAYEEAVHGWTAPFDTRRLKTYAKKRARDPAPAKPGEAPPSAGKGIDG